MEKDKVEPEVKSPKNKKREEIMSRIKEAQISLMQLQAAKLGIEQKLVHLQIELESL